MKTYKHKGKTYRADEPVDWATALEIGGFYFSRAKYLGLPEPPAAFVLGGIKEVVHGEEIQRIIGEYHGLFSQAESKAVVHAWATEIGREGGKAKSEKKTIAARENARRPRPNRKPKKPTFNSII